VNYKTLSAIMGRKGEGATGIFLSPRISRSLRSSRFAGLTRISVSARSIRPS
jgi:hypothetical protein